MDYKQKLQDLGKYSQMATEKDITMFGLTAYELAGTKDPEILASLIDIFDDDCEYPEVMYSLVHAIETYPDNLYVVSVLFKVKDFVKYPEWFGRLVCRIINDKECLKLFKQNIHLADKTKLLELFDVLYEESEAHRPVIEELRKLIEKNSNGTRS